MADLSLPSIGARVRGTGFAPAIARILQAWRNRRSARVLLEMNSRELADIGLTAGDVRLAFGLSFDQDPTERLAALAGERRAARLAQAREAARRGGAR